MIFRTSRSSIALLFFNQMKKTQCNSRPPDLKSVSRAALTAADQVPSGSLAITSLAKLFRSVSRPHWRSLRSAFDRWRLGDNTLRHSFKPADVSPSWFSDWGRRVSYSTPGQPPVAVALMTYSQRSFGRCLFSHWRFFARSRPVPRWYLTY